MDAKFTMMEESLLTLLKSFGASEGLIIGVFLALQRSPAGQKDMVMYLYHNEMVSQKDILIKLLEIMKKLPSNQREGEILPEDW